MNVSEANAVNNLLVYLTGESSGPDPDDQARRAALLLVERASRTLSSGMRPEDIGRLWPTLRRDICRQCCIVPVGGLPPSTLTEAPFHRIYLLTALLGKLIARGCRLKARLTECARGDAASPEQLAWEQTTVRQWDSAIIDAAAAIRGAEVPRA